jgi:hypothetical protein
MRNIPPRLANSTLRVAQSAFTLPIEPAPLSVIDFARVNFQKIVQMQGTGSPMAFVQGSIENRRNAKR